MDAVNDLIALAVASPWLYLVMFGTAVIDGFFPPIPSETVLVAAAAVAATAGGTDLVLLCAVAAAGAMIGDNIAYLMGRRIGTSRFAWMRRPRVEAAFARARAVLRRGGAGLILGARYVPVGRVAVNMSAGALGYPWRRFAPLTVLSGIAWAVYSVAIGLVAGHLVTGNPLLSAAIGVVVAVLVGLVIDRVAAAVRRRREAPATEGRSTGPIALDVAG